MYVLDSSAIIAGLSFPPNEVVVPSSVMREVKEKRVEMSLYRILEPDEKYIKIVVEASKKTGDYEILSDVDIQVLALALQENGTLVTDDFAIQNVASFLGIDFMGATMEIDEGGERKTKTVAIVSLRGGRGYLSCKVKDLDFDVPMKQYDFEVNAYYEYYITREQDVVVKSVEDIR